MDKKRKYQKDTIFDEISTFNFKTGDIILYPKSSDDSLEDKIIEIVTDSIYEHSSIVVVDPWWTQPPKKGVFILQSSNNKLSEKNLDDDEFQPGVQMQDMSYVFNTREHLHLRRLSGVDVNSKEFKDKFGLIHAQVQNKPYDCNLCDWLATGLKRLCCCKCCKGAKKRYDKFVCANSKS